MNIAAVKTQLARLKQYYLTVIVSMTFTLTMVFSVFSIVDTVFLQPFPYESPQQLYWLEGTLDVDGEEVVGTNTQGLFHLQKNAPTNVEIASYFSWSEYKLTDFPERPEVTVFMADNNLFDMLGVEPYLGRLFNKTERLGNKQPSIVLSKQLWLSQFNGDEAIVGKAVQLNSRRFNVIGVAPDGMVLPERGDAVNAIWLPLDMDEVMDPVSFGGFSGGVKALVRASDVDTADAFNAQATALLKEAGDLYTPEIASQYGISAKLTEFDVAVKGDSLPIVLSLMVGVILLALIALVNISSMQMARAVNRQQVLAIAFAFGASWRQLFKEAFRHNLAMITVAALLAILLTFVSFDIIATLGEDSLPRLEHLSLSPILLLFALLVTLIVTLLLSWVELVGIKEQQLLTNIQSSGKGGGKQIPRGVTHLLVALQLGFSLLILTASSQVLYATLNETMRPNHLNNNGIWNLDVSYSDIDNREERKNLQKALVQKLAALPLVEKVSRSSETRIPLAFNVDNAFNETGEIIGSNRQIAIDEHHLTMLGILVEGRHFQRADIELEHGPVIINQRLAEKFFGNPIGQKIYLSDKEPREIIGIAHNTDFPGASYMELEELYIAEDYWGARTDSLALKLSNDGSFMSQAEIVSALAEIDSRLNLLHFASISDDFAKLSQTLHFGAMIAGMLSLMSTVMVIAGIGGMVSYSTKMRRYDMGVKMAMGATARTLLSSELRSLSLPMLTSVFFFFSIIFFTVAYSRTVPDWFFQLNWPLFLAVMVSLIGLTFIACAFPVRGVLLRDPIKALRNE